MTTGVYYDVAATYGADGMNLYVNGAAVNHTAGTKSRRRG